MRKRKNLKLLKYVTSLHSIGKPKYDNVTVICCQHILESLVYLLQHIISLGIKKKNIFIIGKTYSTDIEIYNELIENEYNVSELSLSFNKDYSFDFQFQKNIIIYLTSLQIPKNNKIIILDDGAFLINNASLLLHKNQILFAIEQTSAGYNYIKDTLLHFPIYNVAKSEPKITLEYKFLINLIKKIIKEKVPFQFTKDKKCLILGNGHLGASLMNILKDEISCDVFDIHHKKTMFPKEKLKWDKYDLIIGATGRISLRYLDHTKLKEGCFLVSVSSSDREFDAVKIRKKASVDDCHTDIITNNGIHLINCGFPINFTGKTELSINNIQLTMALILEAFCEGLTKPSNINKIVDLDQNNIKNIKHFFLNSQK